MAKEKQQKRVKPEGLPPRRKDLLSILFLLVLVIVLFYKIIFTNMVFSNENDTATAYSWTKAGQYLEETEGAAPLWMPYPFSGMPAFGSLSFGAPFRLPLLGITAPHTSPVSVFQGILHILGRLLFLNSDDGWLVLHYFLSGVFMFLLARRWGLSYIPSILAAVVFMLSPYSIKFAGEGHGSKLMALSYLPLVVLLTDMLIEKHNLLSFGLFAAGIGTLLLTGHVQIVYYVFIIIGLLLLYRVIPEFKQDKLLASKKVVLFAAGLAIGLCISAFVYLSVHEYAQYSIRGGGITGVAGGLSWDYATSWSFHPFELVDFLIPSFFGFQTPYYWGTMPFSNAAFYVGIIPVLFSFIALMFRRTKMTIFLAGISVLVFLISFGNHLPVLYGPMFDYLPYFDKFRAPSMILHVIAFTAGLLAAFGLQFLLDIHASTKGTELEKLKRIMLYLLGVIGAVLVLGFLLKSSLYEWLSGFMFEKEGEMPQLRQQYGQQAAQVLAQLKQVRFDLLWKDFVKFSLIAGASAGLVMLYIGKKMRTGLFSALTIAVLFVDLIIVIRAGDYIDPKPHAALEQAFTPDAKMAFLKSQPGLFRIFPVGELFGDNGYMYHLIQSTGGYSPAKLKIYQTTLDSCLYRGPDPEFPLNMNIVNMLNVKYILAKGQLPDDRFELVNVDQGSRVLTYRNPGVLPRAFFVNNAIVARDDQEVFRFMNSIELNAAKTAVVEKPLSEAITAPDSSSADVVSFKSNEIAIKSYTSSPALLVVSEVYYPAGWKAYVDGVETEILKTNYVIRSVVVPSGQHEVVMKFDPASYTTGLYVSNGAWGLTALMIIAGLWQMPSVRRRLFPQGQQPN